MTPRVLVLGGSGLLGRYLLDRLPSSFPTVAVSGRAGRVDGHDRVEWIEPPIDATDANTIDAAIDTALDAACPDVVVNAIGAKPPAGASVMDRLNARFPHALASAASRRGARVVHISTDGVFSGERGEYGEDDPPDAIDDYGRSKRAGELAAPHVTLRACFFGRTPRGTGLIEWLITQRGQAVDGFVDYRFSGIAAPLLADLIAVAIDAGLAGLYHVGGDPVSKYELLHAAAKRLALGVEVRPASRQPVDRTLASQRFFSAVGRRRPSVADSIEALTQCVVLSRS